MDTTKHPHFHDLSGQVFGRLTVICFASRINRKTRWNVRCSCGQTATVLASHLVSGHTKSCGCLAEQTHLVHGMCGTPTYESWKHMLDRCRNKKHKHYKYYGGAGITVCPEWLLFQAFHADMGDRPDGHTLDRRDGRLGYYKENCRWATPEQQQNNIKSNVLITHNGETLSCRQWSKRTGVPPTTLRYRLKAGWPIERALSPVSGDHRMIEAIASDVRAAFEELDREIARINQ